LENTMSTPSTPWMQRFAELLTNRQAELQATLQAAAGAAVHASEQTHEVLDFKDVAESDTQAAIDDAAVEHAAQELSQVAAALRRLEDGSYGLCLDCGEPIAEQRLLALPSTPYCTACQARLERPPVHR
jgi:DnaK suppressor protein